MKFDFLCEPFRRIKNSIKSRRVQPEFRVPISRAVKDLIYVVSGPADSIPRKSSMQSLLLNSIIIVDSGRAGGIEEITEMIYGSSARDSLQDIVPRAMEDLIISHCGNVTGELKLAHLTPQKFPSVLDFYGTSWAIIIDTRTPIVQRVM